MLTAFANAFRTPDLRRKLLFVLMIIVVFRAGCADPRPGCRRRQRPVVHQRRGQPGHLQPDQPVLRRRAAAADRLRARDHALHHGEHHPAAAGRGDPAAGGPQEGGPVRPDQDHAIHPLPHPGPRPCSRRPASSRWRAPARSSAQLRQGPAARQRHPDLPGHGDHHDRRHRGDHVARRAHHRARRRQRHVDHDLHPGHRDVPRDHVGGRPGQGLVDLHHGPS